MPWPVYLAFKHLFPTGRKLTWAASGRVLRNALILATAVVAAGLAFLWARGLMGHFFGDAPGLLVAKRILCVWIYLALAMAFVLFVFRISSFFTGMSMLGVMLGVMVLLVVQSVMNGFWHAYQVNLIKAYGHITVRSGDPLEDPEVVVNLLKSVPGVKSVEPIAYGMVMVQAGGRAAFPAVRSFSWPMEFPRAPKETAGAPPSDSAFPVVHSLDVNRPEGQQHPLISEMISGSADDLDNKSALLSVGLRSALGVQVGDKIDVYTPLMLENLKKDTVLMPLELRVAGVFETGWAIVDENTLALTLRTTQQLYGMDDRVHGFEVRLNSDEVADAIAAARAIEAKIEPLNVARLRAGQRPVYALTWLDINSNLLQILVVEKTVMFYIMIFIVVVASFSIASSLVTSVVRKTREIGVLGALGARRGQVALVFCLQGLFIGLAGTALGVALAFLLLNYRQAVVEAFVDRELLYNFYKFLSFPVEYRAADFIKIICCTLLITTLAGLVPAWLAARLKPADCLRQE